MSLISRPSNDVLNHLNRSTQRKHSGIHTVTGQDGRSATHTGSSPFGKLVYGPDAGTPQTAYKPILKLY